jgi:hypothetical protein
VVVGAAAISTSEAAAVATLRAGNTHMSISGR